MKHLTEDEFLTEVGSEGMEALSRGAIDQRLKIPNPNNYPQTTVVMRVPSVDEADHLHCVLRVTEQEAGWGVEFVEAAICSATEWDETLDAINEYKRL